ncbi:hypothetical protein N657DRAFT_641974 [Parathielavia appendiculata]|uniref:Uncharacterized protein n=1 Tax=Parathielavia appendiculata TaxID=2587402 RepID=A0AAN6U7J2_9PEZI|nr:hypothetical protein N657DRAFT_641974 [Parathielavia appendiculata]
MASTFNGRTDKAFHAPRSHDFLNLSQTIESAEIFCRYKLARHRAGSRIQRAAGLHHLPAHRAIPICQPRRRHPPSPVHEPCPKA